MVGVVCDLNAVMGVVPRLTGWWLKVAGELENPEREEVKGSE